MLFLVYSPLPIDVNKPQNKNTYGSTHPPHWAGHASRMSVTSALCTAELPLSPSSASLSVLDYGHVHAVKHTLGMAPRRKTGNALGTATDLVRRAARGLVATILVEA